MLPPMPPYSCTTVRRDGGCVHDVTAAPLDSFYADTLFRELTETSGGPDFSKVAKRADLPTQFPLWNDVAVDDKGYLWVASGVPRRRTQSLAVFSPDGRYGN